MTPKIKIGKLVRLEISYNSDIFNDYREFNDSIGIVIDSDPCIDTCKVLWCSSKLREYDFDSWWHEDYLGLIIT